MNQRTYFTSNDYLYIAEKDRRVTFYTIATSNIRIHKNWQKYSVRSLLMIIYSDIVFKPFMLHTTLLARVYLCVM